jgi:hypothetical protein
MPLDNDDKDAHKDALSRSLVPHADLAPTGVIRQVEDIDARVGNAPKRRPI